ncbi:MAG: TIGR04086 family membrane protein [Butyricicoccus sp.]|nr:TIGR04086 family membrane protein [Butyricicoccus sp.]
MMKKTELTQRSAARLLVCILIGLAAVLLMLAVCSLAVVAGAFSGVPVSVLASGCLVPGCLLAAFRAARCSSSRRLLWALAAGGGVLLCLFICSFVCFDGPLNGLRAAVNAGCVLVSSLLGGILGAAGRRKKRKR